MTSGTPGAVVVGVDGTSAAKAALVWATAHAVSRGAPLTLVNSYPDLDNMPLRGASHLRPSLIEDSRAVLVAATAQVDAIGWSGAAPDRISSALPPQELIAAEAKDASLVVVGQRGHSSFDLHLGSNAHRILETSPVPVVVVPSGWHPRPAGRVVLAVEPGTDTDQAATAFAYEHARETGSPLEVFSVCKPLSITAPGQFYHEVQEQMVEDTKLAQAEAVAGWSEQYPDVKVEKVVAVGHPVPSLAERSDSASMLVIGGPTQRGLLTRMGSVSHGLLQRASCPVAVVRAH